MEKKRGGARVRGPGLHTIHEEEEDTQEKLLQERVRRTDSNGREVEVSRYKVRKAREAEVQYDGKIPQGYEDTGIKYGHTAPYAVERSPISGKNSLYQRRKFCKYRRRVTFCCRRFTDCQCNFTLRHGIACY